MASFLSWFGVVFLTPTLPEVGGHFKFQLNLGHPPSRRRQYVQPGVAHPIDLPGLPDLCISPSIINVPDDDLYGPCGAAAQMAYKGWIAETYGLWENRWRNELRDALNRAEVRPEIEAFGDLRRIRNDLLHNGTASVKACGKCSILKWFDPGERIVFDTRHVLDFLNQIGVLSLRFAHGDSGSCSLKTYRDRNELLSWSPTPRLVSVRTHNDGKEADPPYKPVTVVFDNGVFANVPFQLDEQRRWTALGYAQIRKDVACCCSKTALPLILTCCTGRLLSRRSRADPAMVVHGCLSLVLRSGLGELQEWRRVFPGDAPAEATEP